MRWRAEAEASKAPHDICSWHSLEELSRALHHVQKYLESLKRSNHTRSASVAATKTSLLPNNRKRKAPDSDLPGARDEALGILTPAPSLDVSRSSSGTNTDSSSHVSEGDADIYNGILERKDGRIVAKKVSISWIMVRS